MTNVILLMVDQYMFPPAWENDKIKLFRKKYTPTLNWITENSIRYNHHYINTGACMPSRASILTGTMPKKHQVWNTDGVAKLKNDINYLNPLITPTIGNLLKNNNILDPNNIIYIGKQHITPNNIIINKKRLESIDKTGHIIEKNMEQYKNANFMNDFGFTLLNGPDPHGPQETNSGFLVDSVYVDMAISCIKNIVNNKNYFMTLSLVEPHDIVYFPNLWKMWNNDIPNYDELLGNIDTPTDNTDIDEIVYNNWTHNYHKYFNAQNKYEYRKFYYYLLTILDTQLAKLFDFLKTQDVTVIFTSDHGDLLGTHNNGYQKWYALFEEITHVPLNILSFKNGISLYNKDINTLTCHIDIVPTIWSLFTNKKKFFDGVDLMSFIPNNRKIKCDLRDHITNGPHNIRFVGRFFPDLCNEFDMTFQPTISDLENYAVKASWKQTTSGIIKKIKYYNPITKTKGLKLRYNITNDPCECKST